MCEGKFYWCVCYFNLEKCVQKVGILMTIFNVAILFTTPPYTTRLIIKGVEGISIHSEIFAKKSALLILSL